MKLITEVSEQLEYISEEGKDGEKTYKIRGIFMQAEQQNRKITKQDRNNTTQQKKRKL